MQGLAERLETALCGATLTGGIKIARQSHVYKLRRLTHLLAARRTVKVTIRPWSAGMRAIRSALRRHRKVTATVNASALDAARNRGVATWKVGALL